MPVAWSELSSLPKRASLIGGLLDAAAMSVFYGASGCGKTFLALDLAAHVALGWNWRERNLKQGTLSTLRPFEPPVLRCRGQPHCNRRCMPSRCCEAFEWRLLNGRFVEMIRLRIELRHKPLDLFACDNFFRALRRLFQDGRETTPCRPCCIVAFRHWEGIDDASAKRSD